jgi:hypothetical protein
VGIFQKISHVVFLPRARHVLNSWEK